MIHLGMMGFAVVNEDTAGDNEYCPDDDRECNGFC